jgi:NAD(P) transhydrogenase subunit alpha
MIVGVPAEILPGESRVALVPADLPALSKAGLDIIIQAGAGVAAGYPDRLYQDKGARLVESRDELFAQAELLLQVRAGGACPTVAEEDIARMRKEQKLIAFLDPLSRPDMARKLAEQGVTAFSMEMMPRISRAQSMDALSAMANIAGYRAVLEAMIALPRMCPMLMTAAGTIQPARVFVIGAGVAGLQAIATAKRLGAKIEAYDVRPVVKDQVESVGARFVELPLETGESEGAGGYARAMDEEFYRRQRELMAEVVARSDVVITTAAIPGKRSPLLITREAVQGMQPGSVIVDLAAERGGNCEVTRADETVVENNVTIIGPTNLPAAIPYHASQMYSRTLTNFLRHMVKEGELQLDTEDEIMRDTLVTRDGQVVHERIRSLEPDNLLSELLQR